MDNFKYRLKIDEIDNLKTKKDKTAMFHALISTDSYNEFKALTYLIKIHGETLNIGSGRNVDIKDYLLDIVEKTKPPYDDLLQFCNSDYSLTEFHAEKLYNSRYIPFQVAAYMLSRE